MILLQCQPSDSLTWDLSCAAQSDLILWRLDLGLETPYFNLDDEFLFESLALSLKKFSDEIWPVYQDRTKGAVLYMGSGDFLSFFSWTESQEQNFQIWKNGKTGFSDIYLKQWFCIEAFSHYFQMLAHKLPDEMPIYILIDGSSLGTSAEKAHLLSNERFEHFLLALKGVREANTLEWDGNQILEKVKPSTAFCLPDDRFCSSGVLDRLDQKIQEINTPARVIPEAFLTEQWDEVDNLYVLKGAVSPQGLRKIKGFIATGGTVVEF